MKRRIFGLENEYGLTCTLNGQRRLSPDNVARYLFEKVIPGARNANVFLENGARLYLDTGFHPEYATPECDDVAELVIHDKAGERIVEDLLHPADLRGRRQGAPDPTRLPLLPLPAGAAYLSGDLRRDHVVALDHQHARRAPRRRGEISAPPRHRRRFEYV